MQQHCHRSQKDHSCSLQPFRLHHPLRLGESRLAAGPPHSQSLRQVSRAVAAASAGRRLDSHLMHQCLSSLPRQQQLCLHLHLWLH